MLKKLFDRLDFGERPFQVVMAVMLLLLALVLAARVPDWLSPQKTEAQAPQPIQQLMDVEIFNLTWTNAYQVFTLHNLGQSAHSLTAVGYPTGSNGCSVDLQASGDGTHWTTLTVIPDPNISSPASPHPPPAISFGSGAFTYYRLLADPVSNSCTGSEYLYYVGYQFGPQPPPASENFSLSIAAVTSAYPNTTDFSPYQVLGVQCYNPNSSVAFLQMFDALPTPTLGTAFNYQVGIAATSALNLDLNGMAGQTHLYLGASTTAGGATAVTTALVCNVQLNRRGPFGSSAGY